jgi:hypothetical protein
MEITILKVYIIKWFPRQQTISMQAIDRFPKGFSTIPRTGLGVEMSTIADFREGQVNNITGRFAADNWYFSKLN